jgi:C-terminal peptidase prc
MTRPVPLLLLALALCPAARAAEAKPAERLADKMWTVSDVVLDNHINPPARQELLLAGIIGLLQAADALPPKDLARRASAIATRDDLARLVGELWPKAGGKPADLQARAMAGLLSRVPGGAFLTPADAVRIQKQLEANRYIGIGIQLGMHPKEQYARIITPFRRSPAHKAGARPGDLIVSVDGKDTHKVPLNKVVDWLRGAEGSKLTVRVRQPGSEEVRTLKMTRSVVPFDTIVGYRRGTESDWSYRIQDSPAAYAAVTAFRSSTLHELRRVERQARKEGAGALILDLRQSGGGLLGHGALVADALLDGGTMWKVRDRAGKVKETVSDRDAHFLGWPVVVLIGEHTDPVGRWVAAALQDNGRAVLVGQTVRGHAYARSRVELPDGGVLVMPTKVIERTRPASKDVALSPAGRVPVLTLVPDHKVSLGAGHQEALARHVNYKAFTELPPGVKDEHPEDAQLARAVAVVKAALEKKAGG